LVDFQDFPRRMKATMYGRLSNPVMSALGRSPELLLPKDLTVFRQVMGAITGNPRLRLAVFTNMNVPRVTIHLRLGSLPPEVSV